MKKPLSAAVLLASSTSTIATTAQFTTQPPSSGILQFCPISAPCTISLHSSLLNITSTSDTTLTTTLPLSYLQTPSLLSSLSSKLLTYQDAYINILITSLPPPPPQTTEIRIPARANEEAGVGSGGYTTIGCCGVFMVYHIGLFYAEEEEVGVCQHATRRYMFPFTKENVWDGVVTAVPVGSSNNVEELLGREKGKCRVVTETRSDLEPPWSRPLTKTVVAEFFTGGERLRRGEVTVSSVDRGRKSVPTAGVVVSGGFMEGGGVVISEEGEDEDGEVSGDSEERPGGSGSASKGSNGGDTAAREHRSSSSGSRDSEDIDSEGGTSSDGITSNPEEISSSPSGNSGSSDRQVAPQNNNRAHRPSLAMSLPSETSTADGSNSETSSQRENFDTQEKGSANSRNKSNNRQESPSKSGYNDAAASSTDGAKRNSADRMVLVDSMTYIWSLVLLGIGAAIAVL